MCIKVPSKKQKVRICDVYNHTVIYANEVHMNNFCVPSGHPISDSWMGPEVDTENHSHMVLYSGNETIEYYTEINVSTHNFPSEKWVIVPTSEIIIKISLLFPIVILGLLGNYALLYILLKFKHLRTPPNMIIANMATVDFTYLLVYPWIFLTVDFFQNYQLSEIGCKLEGFLECAFLIINVINLSTISYDRLTAIVLPREKRLTAKNAKMIIFFSWVASFIITCPLVIYRQFKERQWKDFLEIYCTEETKVLAVYWLTLLAMIVWIPLVIMLICYIAIFVKLDRYEQRVLRREHPFCVSYKTRVAKVIFVVVVTFVVCRTPITALIFQRNNWLKQHKQNQILGSSNTLWFSARYLIYVNAAADPLIYGLTNESFRKAFRVTPLVKYFFPRNKVLRTLKPRVSIIQPRKPLVTEWKCDKWLNLNGSDSSSKKNLYSTGVGSQNNLIK